ncbi:MAG: hypothetical protein CFE26_17560 [Verrucomicrobiales bacterium VVV1]|nr:MAG: hypothetical protein CFE26_17560 [Verrucomicrobiales bacterium VVV1]
MQITKVCCQGCGASLEVDESIRFVTCRQCGTALNVVHGARAVHTVLTGAKPAKRSLEKDIEFLKLTNQLLQLEVEWEVQKQGLVLQSQAGHRHSHRFTLSYTPAIVMVLIGLLFMPYQGIEILGMGAFLIIMGVGFGIFAMAKNRKYKEACAAHQVRRTRVELEIDRLRESYSAGE